MRPNNVTLFSAVANTGTKISEIVPSSFMMIGSFQISFTDASAAGTLSIQASNDPVNPSNWNTIANGSSTIASGTLTLIAPQTLSYHWIRAQWVQSGGAGTLTLNCLLQGTN